MIKFGLFLDRTKVKSYTCKNGKSYDYFTQQPYIRDHSISNEFQLGFWGYPCLFDGKLLNLNEFESLPDEEFDIIFLNLERSSFKFSYDDIKVKYKCKIFAIYKEVNADVTIQKLLYTNANKILIPIKKLADELVSEYKDKVIYMPQPVNIEYLRNKFYTKEKSDGIFCYINQSHRTQHNIKISKYFSQKYNLQINFSDQPLNIENFINKWKNIKYMINFDPEYYHVGQQACLSAALGLINLGGNNDSHFNLYPEISGFNIETIENYLQHFLNENKRFEYENLVLKRLEYMYDYEVIKKNIYNLL